MEKHSVQTEHTLMHLEAGRVADWRGGAGLRQTRARGAHLCPRQCVQNLWSCQGRPEICNLCLPSSRSWADCCVQGVGTALAPCASGDLIEFMRVAISHSGDRSELQRGGLWSLGFPGFLRHLEACRDQPAVGSIGWGI